MADDRELIEDLGEPVAANGLFHRRAFLHGGILAGTAVAAAGAKADSISTGSPPWMTKPGSGFTAYGMPSHWRDDIKRVLATNPMRPVTGASRTPLQFLEGTITPAGLHFTRLHNGIPDVDPGKHELLIHGMVKQPLIFTLDALMRYPMETHIRFVECAGNSGAASAQAQPAQATAGELHGLLSCSEWTGVKLSTLLDEAGIDPRAKWVLAESTDAAGMSRSVPLWKCMDDAMVAFYQNGEPIRPEQGFPMRLLLPGFEGNTNVKYLRRLRVMDTPMYTRDETSRYTELMKDGRAREFMLEMEPKSLILKPSFSINLQGPGFYEISGVAWSGLGKVSKVDVSADGGRSWAQAALSEPVLPKALTRFRLAWKWDGQPVVLMSRTSDEKGHVQPSRAEWVAQFAPRQNFHFNAIQSWSVAADGKVSNVYV